VDAGAESVLSITGQSIDVSLLANLRHCETRAKIDSLAHSQKIPPLVLVPGDTLLLVAPVSCEDLPEMVVAIRKVNCHLVLGIEPFKGLQENSVRLLESLFPLLWVTSIEHVLNSSLKSHMPEKPTRKKDGVFV
jgi:hypothetical protein